METSKDNSGDAKPKDQSFPAGFDIAGLIGNPAIMEVLKHLLSGGGAMAANYVLWIKPMQDKIEALTAKLNEQEKRIRELENDQDDLWDELDKNSNDEGLNAGKEYFNVNRKKAISEDKRQKYRSLKF